MLAVYPFMHDQLAKIYADSQKPKPSKTPQLKGLNRHARRRMAALTRAQARKDAVHDKAFAAAVNKAQESIALDELAARLGTERKEAAAPTSELEACQHCGDKEFRCELPDGTCGVKVGEEVAAKQIEDAIRHPANPAAVVAREFLFDAPDTCQECGGYEGCHDVFCTNA